MIAIIQIDHRTHCLVSSSQAAAAQATLSVAAMRALMLVWLLVCPLITCQVCVQLSICSSRGNPERMIHRLRVSLRLDMPHTMYTSLCVCIYMYCTRAGMAGCRESGSSSGRPHATFAANPVSATHPAMSHVHSVHDLTREPVYEYEGNGQGIHACVCDH